MSDVTHFANELKQFKCICYYPSAGTDLSDLDYFGSGGLLWEERRDPKNQPIQEATALAYDPDLFLHSDVNLYHEFADGLDMLPDDCGLYGKLEIIDFRELPVLPLQNLIHTQLSHTGTCFAYKFKAWNSPNEKTLIYCLCENEALVANVLLAHGVPVPIVWSRNWNGGKTYGIWMANVFASLGTVRFYSDWLCIPGNRGEPQNRHVTRHYPELMQPAEVTLQRNNDIHWIDEGAHGWVEEFIVSRR